MSALLRYNARSPRHRNGRAQFTIHFIKEIKKLVPRALLSYIGTWEFRTLEKHKKHTLRLVLLRTSLVFLKFPSADIIQQCTWRVFYILYIHIYIALYFYVSSPVKHPGKINTQTFYIYIYIYTHTHI